MPLIYLYQIKFRNTRIIFRKIPQKGTFYRILLHAYVVKPLY